MELTQVIEKRRSIRRFREDPITDEMIDELLNAARLAPSGSNTQASRFVVVKSPTMRAKLGTTTPYKFITQAPVIFVCCADLTAMATRDKRRAELREAGVFKDVDVDMDMADSRARAFNSIDDNAIRAYLSLNAAIAIEHMVLRAVDLGLGSCWVAGFDKERVREILELDDRIHTVMLLPIGYPAQSPPQRPRFPLDHLVLKTV
jgi:nitroreductase